MLTRREFFELSVEVAMAGTLAAGCGLGDPAVTDQIFHRPWPLPQTRWVLSMRWHDVLFLHWPIRPELIRPLIPNALELDTFRWLVLDCCCTVSHDWGSAALRSHTPCFSRAKRPHLRQDAKPKRRLVF